MQWVDGPVLGIETSGRLTGLALVSQGKLLGECAVDLGASTQELLPGMLQNLLEQHGVSLSELSRIGVSLGPGSFTGLRVGLAWARGLALGVDCPVVGIPSHRALAYLARSSGAQILLMTGLRRGRLCLELGSWGPGDVWTADVPGASFEIENWTEMIESHLGLGRPLLCLGEAVDAAFAEDKRLIGRATLWTDPLSRQRRPAPIAFLAARFFEAEFKGDELDQIELLYLRDADAKKPNR